MSKKVDVKFDIRDVSKRNPKLETKTPMRMFSREDTIPRKYKVKKRWWEK